MNHSDCIIWYMLLRRFGFDESYFYAAVYKYLTVITAFTGVTIHYLSYSERKHISDFLVYRILQKEPPIMLEYHAMISKVT